MVTPHKRCRLRTTQLTWLEVWILRWLYAEAGRSNGLLAVTAQKLFDGFGQQERQQIRASLNRIERAGLIVIRRVADRRPVYLTLTVAGLQYVRHAFNGLTM